MAFVVFMVSCGGGKPPPPKPVVDHATDPVTDPLPPKPEPVAYVPPPAPQRANRPPELFPPAWKKVGVGQQIYFSTAAIDQDLDETAVRVTALPKSAKFDAITQVVTWKPTQDDLKVGKGVFELVVTQPGKEPIKQTWEIAVDRKVQPEPIAPEQSPMIETLLMIRQPKRLEQVNKDWPLDKLLEVGAQGFKWQFSEEQRAKLGAYKPDRKAMWNSFLVAQAQIHSNPRLDPKSDKFDKAVFGDPAAWKIVTFRPRIDRAWTELRVVYKAVKAPEPVFAMFRLRPTVEYVPALPRPPEERAHNNKTFLGMVNKHLLAGGAPNPKFAKDTAAHGKAVSALMTELMTFDESVAKGPFARGFMIGIALEAQMGGGSARNADGSYKHGDAWAWSAQKPFLTSDGKSQAYVNVIIPGFWTQTVPIEVAGAAGKKKTWGSVCGDAWVKGTQAFVPGNEILCRKPLGFVDLPDTTGDKVKGGRIDSNHLYKDYKNVEMQRGPFPIEDGRRDMGEENGMTCSQCHIRNFGMHDYAVPGNTDPTKGASSLNKPIATLNFQIVPSTRWEEFTLEFLKHQECRGKGHLEEWLGPDAAKGFGCPLAK